MLVACPLARCLNNVEDLVEKGLIRLEVTDVHSSTVALLVSGDV